MMFAQANSEHCRHKIFNAQIGSSTAYAAGKEPVRHDPRNAPRASAAGTVVAYSDNSAVMEGATVARFIRAKGGRYGARRRTDAHADEGGDAQPSRPRLRRFPARPPDRGARSATKAPPARRQAEGRADRLHRFASAHSRPDRSAVGSSRPGYWQARAHCVGAVRSCSKARSARPRSTMNSAGPTCAAISARSSSTWPARCAAITSRSCWPAASATSAPSTRTSMRLPAGALLVQLGGPGMLIGMGGGAASSMATGVEHGRSRLRFGAARQCGDRASRAGGHRPLLATGRGAIRSCRCTTWARADCPTHCRNLVHGGGARRAPSTCARFRRRSRACRRARSGATRRRSVTCWRYRRSRSPNSAALCERERCPFAVVGHVPTRTDQLVVADPQFRNHRSMCRSTSCSASRRR